MMVKIVNNVTNVDQQNISKETALNFVKIAEAGVEIDSRRARRKVIFLLIDPQVIEEDHPQVPDQPLPRIEGGNSGSTSVRFPLRSRTPELKYTHTYKKIHYGSSTYFIIVLVLSASVLI